MLLSKQTMGLVKASLRRPSEDDFFACTLSGVANISVDEDDNAFIPILPTRPSLKRQYFSAPNSHK